MKKLFANWKSLVVGLLTLLTGSTWYYVESNTEGSPMAATVTAQAEIKVIPTPMDTINPEMPLKVYRVHYLTYRDFEVSGQGLPTYQARDYYNDVRLFAARGRLNWNKLNEIDTMVLKVFQPVVFLGEQ